MRPETLRLGSGMRRQCSRRVKRDVVVDSYALYYSARASQRELEAVAHFCCVSPAKSGVSARIRL